VNDAADRAKASRHKPVRGAILLRAAHSATRRSRTRVQTRPNAVVRMIATWIATNSTTNGSHWAGKPASSGGCASHPSGTCHTVREDRSPPSRLIAVPTPDLTSWSVRSALGFVRERRHPVKLLLLFAALLVVASASVAADSPAAKPAATTTPAPKPAATATAAAKPAVGTLAPTFELANQSDSLVALDDYRGQWVVLYFYPKDMTPGCTVEARNFQRDLSEFERRDAVVLGVSTDSAESHQQFCAKDSIAFTLLADTKHAVTTQYGVAVEREGKHYASRVTFLIDPKGVVRKVYEKVTPSNHSEEVLADLDRMRMAK
jgi:thioredoxin-dependent peroxiredoxin